MVEGGRNINDDNYGKSQITSEKLKLEREHEVMKKTERTTDREMQGGQGDKE